MSAAIRKTTKANYIYEEITRDIIKGTFKPKQQLLMSELKEKYAVGFSPLREALARLAAHGLVNNEQHCGYQVAPLSFADFQDLYTTRLKIETLALLDAIANGDAKWEGEIIASWYQYEKFLKTSKFSATDKNKWENLHSAFRNSLIKACRLSWLLKLRDILSMHALRYRMLCLNQNIHKNKINDFIKNNNHLVQASLNRDSKLAESYLIKSWQLSAERIAKTLQTSTTNS